jgi:hypothetical protein
MRANNLTNASPSGEKFEKAELSAEQELKRRTLAAQIEMEAEPKVHELAVSVMERGMQVLVGDHLQEVAELPSTPIFRGMRRPRAYQQCEGSR